MSISKCFCVPVTFNFEQNGESIINIIEDSNWLPVGVGSSFLSSVNNVPVYYDADRFNYLRLTEYDDTVGTDKAPFSDAQELNKGINSVYLLSSK